MYQFFTWARIIAAIGRRGKVIEAIIRPACKNSKALVVIITVPFKFSTLVRAGATAPIFNGPPTTSKKRTYINVEVHSGAFSADFVRTSMAKQNKDTSRKLTSF